MIDNAWYVERATLAAERVSPLSEIRDASAPYFSMILVRRRSAAP
jgi:precorrin-2 methylase